MLFALNTGEFEYYPYFCTIITCIDNGAISSDII